ncbi:hypothetical protein [Bradyrhizobium paxllaeri]|uniref:hypothetical protein n=1 Tax=Bradyrhizobium paxllaeri TaxID=190148 RepID=UPI0008109B96|nr:hypothetical protein [Bradyrhizobium paxllaeri]
MLRISQSSINLIVAEEVSSEAYYKRHYTHTEWPGEKSGVTIGIGYDLGYATAAKVKADWGALVDSDMLAAMIECVGVRGTAAKSLSARMHNRITIPWEAAMQVFTNRDIPQWTAQVLKIIPAADKLSPTCLGIIVSIAYNRGASFNLTSDRYREMHAIKLHIGAGKLDLVDDDIRAMKRLWPNSKGLRGRRDREAALWNKGLTTLEVASPIVPPAPAKPDTTVIESSREDELARTKPPSTTVTQNTTTSAIAIGGAIAAQQAQSHGLISIGLAIFLVFLALLAGVTAWWLWYRNRNPDGGAALAPS